MDKFHLIIILQWFLKQKLHLDYIYLHLQIPTL